MSVSRYLLTPDEYGALQKRLDTSAVLAPPKSQKKHSHSGTLQCLTCQHDECTPQTVQATLRSFAVLTGALTLFDGVILSVIRRKGLTEIIRITLSKVKDSARAGAALGLYIFIYRSVHRLLTYAITISRHTLKKRSEFAVKILPSLSAGFLASGALFIHPNNDRRISATVYVFTRMLEVGYNLLDDKGYISSRRPWWFGSWMLFPISSAQLLHAFIFDRDCFPRDYANFIMKYSSSYIPVKPTDYPASVPWPSNDAIIDNLALISKSHWPAFSSPMIYPKAAELPSQFDQIKIITTSAHPAIKKLSCALLHPDEPSCTKNFAFFIGKESVSALKFMTVVYGITALFRANSIMANPVGTLYPILSQMLAAAAFCSLAIGTSWASICGFQEVLPRKLLPTQRFYLSGFVGGLWAFLDRANGRGRFMYSLRLSILSYWRILVKHRRVKPIRAILMTIFESSPLAINGGSTRRALNYIAKHKGNDPVRDTSKVQKEIKES